MTTGKDYGLPEEYADWELRKLPNDGSNGGRPYLRITFDRIDGHIGHDRRTRSVMWAYLFPPKPKPTLPDVKPGAVVRFRCKAGSIRRAIRSNGGWHVFESGSQVVYGFPRLGSLASDNELLRDVDDDGFTIELGGLE